MKKLNKTGPSTDPWGTPLVTSLQPDSAPLMPTLWVLPFSQFSIHFTDHPSTSQSTDTAFAGNGVNVGSGVTELKLRGHTLWYRLLASGLNPTKGCSGCQAGGPGFSQFNPNEGVPVGKTQGQAAWGEFFSQNPVHFPLLSSKHFQSIRVPMLQKQLLFPVLYRQQHLLVVVAQLNSCYQSFLQAFSWNK